RRQAGAAGGVAVEPGQAARQGWQEGQGQGVLRGDHQVVSEDEGGRRGPRAAQGTGELTGEAMFSKPFLNPERADADGLVAVGGDLRPERLLEAYRCGVFPWYSEGDPICWWSPDPRAIFELDGLHVSRRLARTIRSGRFTVTVNQDF